MFGGRREGGGAVCVSWRGVGLDSEAATPDRSPVARTQLKQLIQADLQQEASDVLGFISLPSTHASRHFLKVYCVHSAHTVTAVAREGDFKYRLTLASLS